MSIESVRSFIHRVRTDKDFAQKVEEFNNNAAAQSAVIGAAGFDFTIEEFTEEMMNPENHVTDKELHDIARSMNKYIRIGEEQA